MAAAVPTARDDAGRDIARPEAAVVVGAVVAVAPGAIPIGLIPIGLTLVAAAIVGTSRSSGSGNWRLDRTARNSRDSEMTCCAIAGLASVDARIAAAARIPDLVIG